MNPPKKAETKPEKEDSTEVPQQNEDKPESVNLKKVRQEIKRAVGSEAVKMVRKIVEKKGDPSYLALKYLFEIAGLYPASSAEETEQEDSLAKILLRHLGLEDEIKAGSEVTKDAQGNTPAEQKDAVK
jgi:hypothetical protein